MSRSFDFCQITLQIFTQTWDREKLNLELSTSYERGTDIAFYPKPWDGEN
jgi:hypothetical protein